MRSKTAFRSLWIAVAMFATLLFTRGIASASVDHLTFTTPFSFIVNGQVMPAGTYQVHRVEPYRAEVLELSSTNGHGALIVVRNTGIEQSRPQPGPDQAGVTFDTANGQYVLDSLWDEAMGSAHSVSAYKDVDRMMHSEGPRTVYVPASHN